MSLSENKLWNDALINYQTDEPPTTPNPDVSNLEFIGWDGDYSTGALLLKNPETGEKLVVPTGYDDGTY